MGLMTYEGVDGGGLRLSKSAVSEAAWTVLDGEGESVVTVKVVPGESGPKVWAWVWFGPNVVVNFVGRETEYEELHNCTVPVGPDGVGPSGLWESEPNGETDGQPTGGQADRVENVVEMTENKMYALPLDRYLEVRHERSKEAIQKLAGSDVDIDIVKIWWERDYYRFRAQMGWR